MIYEIRTYTMTIGDSEEAVQDFGNIMEERKKISRLIGFFHTAVGDLNRVLHIWEYENSAHREEVRTKTLSQSWWPPLKAEKILYQTTRLMRPSPFLPEPRTGKMGNIYLIFSDYFQTGKLPVLNNHWSNYLSNREEISPLAGAFTNAAGEFEQGVLNEFIHIWPFKDANEMMEAVSKENTITGWKDGQKDYLRSQSSNIWYPADYSPMH